MSAPERSQERSALEMWQDEVADWQRGVLASSPLPEQWSDADAALWLQRMYEPEGAPELVCDENQLWRYCPPLGIWQPLRERDLSRTLLRLNGTADEGGKRVSLSERRMRDTLTMLARLLAPEDARGFFAGAARGFAYRGGFLRVDLVKRQILNLAPSPEHRARLLIDAEYDPGAWQRARKDPSSLLRLYLSTVHGCVAWDEADGIYSTEEIVSRQEDRRALVRAMGEVLFVALSDAAPHYNKAILLYGGQGTGKSSYIELLHSVIPEYARCSISPQSMEDDYQGAELKGKRLNVVTELNASAISKESGFKAIVSGEPITRREIRKPPVCFRPSALHVFAGNQLPAVLDSTDAFWIRWLPLHFATTHRATSTEVKDIGATIAREELAAVLAWAVECGEALLERGTYTQPGSAEAVYDEWRSTSDSVAYWMRACCEVGDDVDPDQWETASGAYGRYRAFCEDHGFKAVSIRSFGTRLQAGGASKSRSRDGVRYSLRVLESGKWTL